MKDKRASEVHRYELPISYPKLNKLSLESQIETQHHHRLSSASVIECRSYVNLVR